MSWNRIRFDNVMGDTGRRKCRRDDDLAGDFGRRCKCECRFVNDRVASRIAVRGPGCIAGTGRCGRDTARFLEQDFGFDDDDNRRGFCGQVSPSGNVQFEGRRRRRDCNAFNRCLRELLEDLFDHDCPK